MDIAVNSWERRLFERLCREEWRTPSEQFCYMLHAYLRNKRIVSVAVDDDDDVRPVDDDRSSV